MSREFQYEASWIKILPLVLLGVFSSLSSARAANINSLENVDCVIYPSQEADIGSDSIGVLQSLLVDRSEFVREGNPLAQLESSAEQAAVALATARAHAAAEVNFRQLSADHSNRQFSRVEKLTQQSAVSAKDLDDRKTEAQLGEQQLLKAVENKNILALELARAKVVLEKRTIRSPFSGVVVETFKSAGEYVDSDPILRIVQLHPLHIETIIPAEHVGDIVPGMSAEIVSSDNPDKRWTAQVDRVDNVVDVASGTFGVRLELPNPDFTITAGLRCQLNFINDKVSVASAANSQSTVSNDTKLKPNVLSRDKATVDVKGTSMVPTVAALKVPMVSDQGETKQNGEERIGAPVIVDSGNTNPQNKLSCISEGPYIEKGVAQEQAKKWSLRGETVELVTKLVIEKQGYFVMSPEFDSRDDASTYLSSLETAGITDSFLPSKITPVRVSIGAFREHDKAASRVKQLSSKNIESEIRPWEKSREEYFLVGQRGQSFISADCESPSSAQ